MSNCKPQRNLKTGKIQESLCETCKNKLHIEYFKIPLIPLKEEEKVEIYDCSCIYFNSNRACALDRMLIMKCNQYQIKPEIKHNIKSELVINTQSQN